MAVDSGTRRKIRKIMRMNLLKKVSNYFDSMQPVSLQKHD